MKIILFNKEINIEKKKLILIIVIPFIAIILGTFGFIKLRSEETVFIGKETNAEIMSIETSSIDTLDATDKTIDKTIDKTDHIDEIKVYIVGCVKKEGIVTLKKGQIINDAVMQAGGLTEDADLRNINMAFILTENVMIKVKSKKEIQNSTRKTSEVKVQTVPKSDEPKTGTGIEVVNNSGGTVLSETTKENSKKGKININTATIEELDTLPRVGEKTANDIISYREKAGGFKKIEDIMEVPRIGEKTFADLKDLIEVK
jgi:competence protein ComEA